MMKKLGIGGFKSHSRAYGVKDNVYQLQHILVYRLVAIQFAI